MRDQKVEKWSHERHQQHELELSAGEDLPSCYTAPRSIDAWRHDRMFKSILPVIEEYSTGKWMTVGDGRFGSDAFFLRSQGLTVMATSISAHTLDVAHARGFIQEFSAQNAEAFSLEDGAVDVTVCKEAFHHFPRPALGFYEMMRVSSKAVVLIEPIDGPRKPLAFLKLLGKKLFRKDDLYDQFEPAGNFIFRLNIKETAKMLTAMGYECFAWKGLNNFWHKPFDSASIDRLSKAWIGTRFVIRIQDGLCRIGLLNYGLATVVCFKAPPSAQMRSKLKSSGFEMIELPVNPYKHS